MNSPMASHPSLKRTEHRPWPVPAGEWTWRQNWRDLLFAHYRIPSSVARGLVPAELEVQEFDGSAWVGVVPFRIEGLMKRPFPDMPGLSAFPELNVRLYVTLGGKAGVWFLSLDAATRLGVWGARTFFHLPYHHARMSCDRAGNEVRFQSARRSSGMRFEARYRPEGEVFEAQPGSIEAFLAERYCLYAKSKDGGLYRGEIHHAPWPLQRAEGKVEAAQMLAVNGIEGDLRPPLLHFSEGVDVVMWPLEKLK